MYFLHKKQNDSSVHYAVSTVLSIVGSNARWNNTLRHLKIVSSKSECFKYVCKGPATDILEKKLLDMVLLVLLRYTPPLSICTEWTMSIAYYFMFKEEQRGDE